jgi:hypothetical protein
MRILLLSMALCLTAASEGHDEIRFVHPKRAVILASPGGVDIPVQTFVVPNAANRAWRLEWQGATCGGSSTKDLAGEDDRALHPIQPIHVRAGYGVCVFAAAVYGAGGKLRARTQLEVRVCGGGEECS